MPLTERLPVSPSVDSLKGLAYVTEIPTGTRFSVRVLRPDAGSDTPKAFHRVARLATAF